MFWRVHESPPSVVFTSGPVLPAYRRPRMTVLASASPCFAVAKLGFQTTADFFCHDLPRSPLCRSREKTQSLVGVQRSTSAQASLEPAVSTHETGPGVRSTTWKVLPPSLVAEIAPLVFLQVIPLPTRPCSASQKAIEFGTREARVFTTGFTLVLCARFVLCPAPPHPPSATSRKKPSSSETRTRDRALAMPGTIKNRRMDCLLETRAAPASNSRLSIRSRVADRVSPSEEMPCRASAT